MKEADQYCRERGCRGFIANQALYNLGYRYMNPMDDDTLVCADEEMQQYHREHTRQSPHAIYGRVQRFLP